MMDFVLHYTRAVHLLNIERVQAQIGYRSYQLAAHLLWCSLVFHEWQSLLKLLKWQN